MDQELIVERLFEKLITGDRNGARAIVQETAEEGVSAEELSHEVFWRVLEMISTMYRADHLATVAHHYATRLLRSLVDQTQTRYTQKKSRNSKILMFSGHSEADELAGQLVADLAEADGYDVCFGGGGVANDEILNRFAPAQLERLSELEGRCIGSIARAIDRARAEGIIDRSLDSWQHAVGTWGALTGVLLLAENGRRVELAGAPVEVLYWQTFEIILRGAAG